MADVETTADELLELVKSRLHDDWLMSMTDEEHDEHQIEDWHTAHPASPEAAARNIKRYLYGNAKRSAQAGNIEPLCKILTQLTGDPDIAKFIKQPPPPPRPKHARKAPNPFYDKREERQQQVETLHRIRQIIQQEMGKTRDTRALVSDIACRITGVSRLKIQELLKRGR